MEATSSVQRLRTKAEESISFKLLIIGALSLALLIPSAMISELVSEREYRRDAAIAEVGAKWGQPQLVSGPVLHVPYQQHWSDEKGKLRTSTEMAHFLPDGLQVNGQISSQLRYRGIFEVVLYTAKLSFSGSFAKPSFDQWNIRPEDVRWKDAFISLGITDGRGIQQEIYLNWQNEPLALRSMGGTSGGLPTSLSTPVKLLGATGSPVESHSFSFELLLKGHNYLQLLPLGKHTAVTLEGDWANPSFQGAFLPEEREVTPEGFSASWKVLDLNRSFAQQWQDETYYFDTAAFGLELLVPVDGYQKTTRAQKYALLFIGLTFLVLVFAELVKKKRVHPFQYVLIGLAICLFYLLLLSLSEHLAFNLAYVVSAGAITVLLTLYALQVFKSREFAATLGAYFASLYGYLFVLLQLNDYALLAGTIGLFIALAAVMYLSGRISWYPEPAASPA